MLALTLAAALAAPAQPPAKEEPVVTLVKSKVKDAAKPFTLLVTLKIKPGQEAAFEAAYKTAFAGTKAEAGYIAYALSRSADDPAVYVLFEQWKSADGLAAHMKEPHTKAFVGLFGELAAGPAELKVLTAVAGD